MPAHENSRFDSGFTLLEVLLVVGAISILSSIVLLALNPSKQLGDARNAQRQSDVLAIMNAIYQYSIDNRGAKPESIDETLRMLGTATEGCTISCEGNTSPNPNGVVIDRTQADFDEGEYHEPLPGVPDTKFNTAEGGVTLTDYGMTNGIGTYTSKSIDGGEGATWTSFAWTPQWPSLKELPDNQEIETGYPRGNMNMLSNTLLLHMNEATGGTCPDGSDICDSSGNGHHGTAVDVTYGAFGRLDTAIHFDNDRVIFGDILDPGPYDMTACAWIKWDGSGQNQTIVNKEDLFSIQIQNGYVRYMLAPDTEWRGDTTFPIAPDAWNHVCIKYDHTSQYLYRNGLEVYTRPQSGDIGSNNERFCVGANRGNCNGDRMRGAIDEIAFFSQALSEEMIEYIYLRGATAITMQLRVCDRSDCSDASGFDLVLTELQNDAPSPPSILFTIPSKRFLQYASTLETLTVADTPILNRVEVNYIREEGMGELTAESCLDLSDDLLFTYLTEIPKDPSIGTDEKTYYAIQRNANGRINVKSCGVEQNKTISITQ
jgi:prepilin-type N-terminal cleavage/methylation domain-containing protein